MADDYTPTTEQVRDGYRFDPEAEYHNPTVNWAEKNGRAFDRWLTEQNRQVAEVAWDRAMEDRDGFPGVSGLTNPYSKED